MVALLFFFFKQKTAYEMRISDWSSDVCSSDLGPSQATGAAFIGYQPFAGLLAAYSAAFSTLKPSKLSKTPMKPGTVDSSAQSRCSSQYIWTRLLSLAPACSIRRRDRKNVVQGKRVDVRVDPCGRWMLKTKHNRISQLKTDLNK